MDKIAANMDKFFIGAAVLGGISCLARADYNLPLFIFVYFMWFQDPVFCHNLQKEKFKIIGLLVITFIIDIVWAIYWYSFWNSPALVNWDSTLHTIVIFCSSANILLKVSSYQYQGLIVGIMFLTDKKAIIEGMPGNGKFMNFP